MAISGTLGTAFVFREGFMRRIRFFALGALLLTLILSCASGPVVIPDGLSPAELIQKAQDASDKYNYNQAAQYYQAILDRFPDNLPMVCAAEYEIAFIKYKEKKYVDAKAGFEKLLARYNGTDAELLPAQYKILGEKILAKIELEKK
jgi:outer membrane protein assembly factor BamD (BamD/ComL family)